MEGVKLTELDDEHAGSAKRDIERKTGARGLRSNRENGLLGAMFDLPGLEGVGEVVINRGVAESKANPVYLYGKGKSEPTEQSA